jgi:hypothetical protein
MAQKLALTRTIEKLPIERSHRFKHLIMTYKSCKSNLSKTAQIMAELVKSLVSFFNPQEN